MINRIILLSFVIVPVQNTWEHSFMLVRLTVILNVRDYLFVSCVDIYRYIKLFALFSS